MAYLVTLTPSTVCPLLAHEVVTCAASRLPCLVCFTSKGKALQSKHRCISKANAPRAHPTAFRLLNIFQKLDTAPNCFAVDKVRQLDSLIPYTMMAHSMSAAL